MNTLFSEVKGRKTGVIVAHAQVRAHCPTHFKIIFDSFKYKADTRVKPFLSFVS